jgi:hypothetical protein
MNNSQLFDNKRENIISNIITTAKTQQVSLWSENGKLKFDAPRGLSSELRSQLKTNKHAIVSLLQFQSETPKSEAEPVAEVCSLSELAVSAGISKQPRHTKKEASQKRVKEEEIAGETETHLEQLQEIYDLAKSLDWPVVYIDPTWPLEGRKDWEEMLEMCKTDRNGPKALQIFIAGLREHEENQSQKNAPKPTNKEEQRGDKVEEVQVLAASLNWPLVYVDESWPIEGEENWKGILLVCETSEYGPASLQVLFDGLENIEEGVQDQRERLHHPTSMGSKTEAEELRGSHEVLETIWKLAEAHSWPRLEYRPHLGIPRGRSRWRNFMNLHQKDSRTLSMVLEALEGKASFGCGIQK